MAAQNGDDAYVTLLLSDSYLPGALVLAHSLRDAGTTKKLAVLVTLDTVSAEVITQLKSVFDLVIPVPRIRNEKPANLYLMNRADLHSAFTKINLWKQTQFRRIVYLDADVVAYRAPDELFDLEHPFSAAPDIGWPDLFNTGVMALTPNLGDYYALVAMAERGISFDGADQGLLNMHFKNSYNRLSFTYNVTPSGHYQYVPAYRHFQSSINMVHFIGSDKPWALGREASSGASPYDEMLGRWWAVYDRHYRQPSPQLTPTDASQHKVPEIVQYFVKGEFRPQTTTHVIPTGQPPLHQGRSTHDAYHHAPPPPSQSEYHQHHQHHHHQDGQPHEHHHHEHSSQYHHEKSQPGDSVLHPYISPPNPGDSLSYIEGPKAEAREEQVPGPQGGAPAARHEEREHKPEPRPAEHSWDAQRQAPPADSKPEAMNFPQVHYEMSSDPAPFVPPPRYPSPPKNMWYEVPREKPAPPSEKPRPIFPWEIEQPRPSRVFADNVYPSEPSLTEDSTAAPSGTRTFSLEYQTTMTEPSMTESSTADHKSEPSSPATPTIRVTPSDPWASFTRVNAWDDDPAIDKYVGNMPLFRRHRSSGSLVGVGQASPRAAGGSDVGSQHETKAGAEWRRRGSKLTDFPTAVERPSLPVTPAPIRRPKFWGVGGPGIDDEAEDDGSRLPAADGVPEQSEWDPVARLQLLAKQQSELLLQKLGAGEVSGGGDTGGAAGEEYHSIPKRPLPFGSEDLVSPKYIARSSDVLSPQPVKPAGARPQGILGQARGDNEATPRSTSATTTETAKPAQSGISIPEPSFHGPGAAWEKDEDYLSHSTALPPSEEEKDVLQT